MVTVLSEGHAWRAVANERAKVRSSVCRRWSYPQVRKANGRRCRPRCKGLVQRQTVRTLYGHARRTPYLFFNLPLGSTEVSGAIGRMDSGDVLTSGGKLVSFFGFLTILLLSCMPLAIEISSIKPPM